MLNNALNNAFTPVSGICCWRQMSMFIIQVAGTTQGKGAVGEGQAVDDGQAAGSACCFVVLSEGICHSSAVNEVLLMSLRNITKVKCECVHVVDPPR
jgi:hypothetical protein